MNLDFILYILAVMIFWDLSLHIIMILGWDIKLTRSRSIFSYYFPHLRWKKTPNGPVERENWRRTYDRFWITYWGLAFILLIVYLITKI